MRRSAATLRTAPFTALGLPCAKACSYSSCLSHFRTLKPHECGGPRRRSGPRRLRRLDFRAQTRVLTRVACRTFARSSRMNAAVRGDAPDRAVYGAWTSVRKRVFLLELLVALSHAQAA